METRFIKPFKSRLVDEANRRITTLLWGDPVHVEENVGGKVKVKARGWEGFLSEDDLTDQSLLEIYAIDVGQGDGLLLKTPEGKWHLIDAGIAARNQMTKKGAANFLRWKFQKDLLQDIVELENVLVTHSDFDHYGGMIDVLSGRLVRSNSFNNLEFPVRVRNFYHCGMGRFRDSPKLGQTTPGEVQPFPVSPPRVSRTDRFISELLSDKQSFSHPTRPFEATFAEFAALVGSVPQNVRRLSHLDRHLPGYAPGESPVVIHVLGPIFEEFASDQFGLREFSSESITRNGHSIMLRIDFGQARILLTGDSNKDSQRLLLSYHAANEFAVDVAKACHHGSEDVDIDFIKAMQARATVISSGDNEDYSHPRPLLMGASARYGRESKSERNATQPPLLYSTELARSVELAFAAAIRVDSDGPGGSPPANVNLSNTEVKADISRAKFRHMNDVPISNDLVYGLVNVRTDGTHILCATMNESGADFDVKVLKAGVNL